MKTLTEKRRVPSLSPNGSDQISLTPAELDERDTIILEAFRKFGLQNPKTGKVFVQWKRAFAENPDWVRATGAGSRKGMQALYNHASNFLKKHGLSDQPSAVTSRKKRKLPALPAPAPAPVPLAVDPALATMLDSARSGMIHHAITTTLHDITKTMFQATLDLQAALVALNQQVLASGVAHGTH